MDVPEEMINKICLLAIQNQISTISPSGDNPLTFTKKFMKFAH